MILLNIQIQISNMLPEMQECPTEWWGQRSTVVGLQAIHREAQPIRESSLQSPNMAISNVSARNATANKELVKSTMGSSHHLRDGS